MMMKKIEIDKRINNKSKKNIENVDYISERGRYNSKVSIERYEENSNERSVDVYDER